MAARERASAPAEGATECGDGTTRGVARRAGETKRAEWRGATGRKGSGKGQGVMGSETGEGTEGARARQAGTDKRRYEIEKRGSTSTAATPTPPPARREAHPIGKLSAPP